MMRARSACLLLAAGAVVAVAGCGMPPAQKQFDLQSCDAVHARGAFDLVVSTAGTPSVRVVGDAAAVDAVEVEADGGRVRITGGDTHSLQVTLSCPTLRELELLTAVEARLPGPGTLELDRLAVYGESAFTAPRLAAGALDLRGAGSARIRIDELVAESVRALLAGASQAAFKGEAAELSVEISGTSALAAGAFMAQTATIRARGSSRADVFATAHLTAQVSDEAALTYAGNPDLALEERDQATIEAR